MRRRTIIRLAIVAATVAAVAGDWAARRASESDSSPHGRVEVKVAQPIVVVDPNIGEVWEAEAAVVRVRLRNVSDRSLWLSRIGGTCNCVKVAPESATLAPRGELDEHLTYDLTHRTPADFGKLSRPFEITLSVEVEGRMLKPFVLAGTCRSHLATSTTVLHFGESNVRGGPPVSRWLDVTTDDEAANIQVIASGSAVKIGPVERHGHGWRFGLAPDTERVQGQFETDVRVIALDAAGIRIGDCRVAVDGTVRESMEGVHAP